MPEQCAIQYSLIFTKKSFTENYNSISIKSLNSQTLFKLQVTLIITHHEKWRNKKRIKSPPNIAKHYQRLETISIRKEINSLCVEETLFPEWRTSANDRSFELVFSRRDFLAALNRRTTMSFGFWSADARQSNRNWISINNRPQRGNMISGHIERAGRRASTINLLSWMKDRDGVGVFPHGCGKWD